MRAVIRHLRAAALSCKGDGPSDGQLLESFIVRRDETAFEALVRRHGPMVLGVCQRVLRNVEDAEDAFQATFLVLSRKADSVKPREMVGNWLYGVAYRTAMKARTMNAKRRTKERIAGERPRLESCADEELLEQLDRELSRLPDNYRVPVVLCELEGRSRKEVARMLVVPEGTLSWRLAQAKKMLAKRLSQHSATFSVVALATTMTEGLSPALRATTVKAALTARAVPAKVLALTEGVMKAMFLSKLKITACAAALMLVAGVGATSLTYRAAAQQPAITIRPQSDDLEALRLEIEALRKSLQATREQVRSLAEEMRTLKSVDKKPTSTMPRAVTPAVGVTSGTASTSVGRQPAAGFSVDSSPAIVTTPATQTRPATSPFASTPQPQGTAPAIDAPATVAQPRQNSYPDTANPFTKPRTASSDPVAHAEKALKRLRANPGDKQAIEALERALKRLKEQEKPDAPAEQNPRIR